MNRPAAMRIGDWHVDPAAGLISREGETIRLDARAMQLLLCLAARAGEVVTTDELLDQVWPATTVSQDSVYQAVASLRRLLGDNAKQPDYIVTIPRQGYRLVAKVIPDEPTGPPPAPAKPRPAAVIIAATGSLCALVLIAGLIIRNANAPLVSASQPERSIAVLPFLDLTSEAMSEEYAADGVTEELIDKISRIPGFRVAPPTSSFYFKDKRATISDIANALHVAYVLDGSMRKSGTRLRVAVRLIRADNGFVIWSETYDRQGGDIVKIQDNIADDVARALKARI